MKIFKRVLILSILAVLVCFCFTGCRKPYDKPEFMTIEPSQTAFLIPLVGDSTTQDAFGSEEMRITAEAEAEANKKIGSSITDTLIEKTYAENWDGKLPTIVGGNEHILLPSDVFE